MTEQAAEISNIDTGLNTKQKLDPETERGIQLAQDVFGQLAAVEDELTSRPAAMLISLSQRQGNLTPALEALTAKLTEMIVTAPTFHAIDILSKVMLNALKNDRVEMLPHLVQAYKNLAPETWSWPYGPDAPRFKVDPNKSDSETRPTPFLRLAESPAAVAALLDKNAVGLPNYRQAVLDAIGHNLAADRPAILKPLIEAYKIIDPDNWSWPADPAAETNKVAPFLSQARSAQAAEVLLDETAAPSASYRHALSDAISHHVSHDAADQLRPIIEAYKAAIPDHWEKPVDPKANTFLSVAASDLRSEAVKVFIAEKPSADTLSYALLWAAGWFRPGVSRSDKQYANAVAITDALLDAHADPRREGKFGNESWSSYQLIWDSRNEGLRAKVKHIKAEMRPPTANPFFFWKTPPKPPKRSLSSGPARSP